MWPQNRDVRRHLRSAIAHPRALLLALCMAAQVSFGQALSVRVTHGARNPVCAEIASIIRGSPPEEFRWLWHQYFNDVLWNPISITTTDRDGKTWNREVRYSFADVDNDGTQDVALLDREFIQSVDVDRLYLTSTGKFADAIREGTLRELLIESPSLNDGFNSVDFSPTAVLAAPAELHLWRRNRETFVLMMEHRVASSGQQPPAELLVGRVPPSSVNEAAVYPHLRPRLVCRFTVSPKTKIP